MNTSEIEPVARFQQLLKAMQEVSFKLKTARPKLQPSGVYSNLTELRNESYERMINLYKEAEDALSVLEYELLPTPSENHEEIAYKVRYLKERYSDIKVEFREAQLKSKTLEKDTIQNDIERRLEEEKDGFKGKDEVTDTDANSSGSFLDEEKLNELTKQDQLLEKNKKITSKLQNINTIMHESVLSGEKNLQDLSGSTSSMASLSNKYGHFAEVLVKTNGLVKTINESSDAERRQIYRSIYFFIFVCCYIIYKRILKRPVHLFLWLFFNFFRYTMLGGKKIGFLGGNRKETLNYVTASISASASVSSVTSSAISSVTSSIPSGITSSVISNNSSLSDTISKIAESVSSISRDEL